MKLEYLLLAAIFIVIGLITLTPRSEFKSGETVCLVNTKTQGKMIEHNIGGGYWIRFESGDASVYGRDEFERCE